MKIKAGDVFVEKKNNLFLKFSNLNDDKSIVILLDENTNKKYSLKMETFKTAISSGKLTKKCDGIDQLLESNYQILLRSEKDFEDKMKFLNEVFVRPKFSLELLNNGVNSPNSGKTYPIKGAKIREKKNLLIIDGSFTNPDTNTPTDFSISFDRNINDYTIIDKSTNKILRGYALDKKYFDYIVNINKDLRDSVIQKLNQPIKVRYSDGSEHDITPDINGIEINGNWVIIPGTLSKPNVPPINVKIWFDVKTETTKITDQSGKTLKELEIINNPLIGTLKELNSKYPGIIGVKKNAPPPNNNPDPNNNNNNNNPNGNNKNLLSKKLSSLIEPNKGINKVMNYLTNLNMNAYNQNTQNYINQIKQYFIDVNSKINDYVTNLHQMGL
jgi:hypothetical protein